MLQINQGIKSLFVLCFCFYDGHALNIVDDWHSILIKDLMLIYLWKYRHSAIVDSLWTFTLLHFPIYQDRQLIFNYVEAAREF